MSDGIVRFKDRHVLFSTLPEKQWDGEKWITIPANTVLNVILYDGVSQFDPGPQYRLKQSDTMIVGDKL